MTPKRRILIFHQAALGDFVLTWPVAMALSRVFAQSRVTYVTGRDKGRLAEQAIGVEAVDAEQGWHPLFGDAADETTNVVLDESVRRLLAATQCVVLFAQNPEPQFLANVTKAAGEIACFHVAPNPPAGVHVLDHQLAQFAHAPPMQAYVRQMQNVVRERGLTTSAKVRSGVVIHPGSGSPKKNWPAESFAAVARQLAAAGAKVKIILGEVERERFSGAERKSLAAAAPVVEPANLLELHGELQSAARYLGNDSGPTHLAAMLGVPTWVLHGPATDLACWRPVGPGVAVLPFETSVGRVADQLTA